MAYIRYEDEPNSYVDFSDVTIDYDYQRGVYIFEVPGRDDGSKRMIPENRVYTIEYPAGKGS